MPDIRDATCGLDATTINLVIAIAAFRNNVTLTQLTTTLIVALNFVSGR